ncbi:MAG: paraquat-inducible protein A [Paracoccaceae bacterium]|nr:paraquat-inducible protein A [Paracoccaceae bacterium]
MLRYLNLGLLVLFPLSWFAPLMHAGLLPLFGLSQISIITGVQSLWQTDIILACLVMFFALIAPMLKTGLLALMHFGVLPPSGFSLLALLGKLAMADVFLIALYIVIFKSVGLGHVETAWGLYFFSLCILASVAVQALSQREFRQSTLP